MGLVINTNLASMIAQRHLAKNTSALGLNLEKLASGFRINRAADDAAGLQISETLRSQIRGVNQAINNAQDGSNMMSIAEGTLMTINDHLQRIRELTVQAANDTNGSNQRLALDQEIKARISDINRIAKAAEFNGIKLLSTIAGSLRLQVGANAAASINTIEVKTSALGPAGATALGLASAGVSMGTTASSARAFLGKIDTAITRIGQRLAKIGSIQNRLQSSIQNLSITSENYAAAESRIRNVDVAKESASLAQNQILQQAAASILSQANQAPQLALQLLGR